MIGATGAIGLAAVRMLVRAGHTVRAMVRSREKFHRLSPEDRVEVVSGEILDRASVAAAMEEADAAVHCVSFPAERFTLNWDALRHVFEGLTPRAHLIYPSNAWVYEGGPGMGRDGTTNAGTPRLGELAADMEKAVLGQSGTVIRLPWCYGPGVRTGLMYSFFQRALAGKTVWFPGELDRDLNLIYIEDAARALVAPLGRPVARGAQYEAGGFPALVPSGLASLISQVLGRPLRLRALPPAWLRVGARFHRSVRALRDLRELIARPSVELDRTDIRRDLGWLAEVDHAEGVRRTVNWFRSSAIEPSVNRVDSNLAPPITPG